MGNEQSTQRIIGSTMFLGPIGAVIAVIGELERGEKVSKALTALSSRDASSQIKRMTRDKLWDGEVEFECKIEYPVYEKVRYNRGYLYYERFRVN